MIRTAIGVSAALMLLAGCGNHTEEPTGLDADLRSAIAEDHSPETLTTLATYLEEHRDTTIESDLGDETAALLVTNIDAVRKSIADPGSPTSLKADPEALLRVAVQVEADEEAAKSVLAAVTTAAIDEVDEATKTYVTSGRGSADDSRFRASLADSSRASGGLATALGVGGYDSEADVTDVFAYLVDHKDPTDLVVGVPLNARTVIASNYLHAPKSALTGDLAQRPRYDKPGVIEAIYEWGQSAKSPFPMGNIPGLSEEMETQWGAGEDIAIEARK